MKKLILALCLMVAGAFCFARQVVEVYSSDIYSVSIEDTYRMKISNHLLNGWKVVSVTSFNNGHEKSDYILVVYEVPD